MARTGAWIATAAVALGVLAAPMAAIAAPAVDLETGDTVFIGGKQGYPGTGMYPLWPGDAQVGDPLYWAYCVENQITARTGATGQVGDFSDYVGSNYFTDPAVQGKVLWVLAHSYPALSLEEFGAAAGVPGISRDDAIEATQYAVWRYTDLTFDASWPFETQGSEDAYWHLVNGANASPGLTPGDLEVTASVSAPAASQTADSLIGPFVVATDQPTVSVASDPDAAITDAAGNPIDVDAVVDGQELFLDLRGTSTAGSATLTVTADGSSNTGKIITVPTVTGGTPTEADHAQTMILVTPSDTATTAQATVGWAALPVPAIGTSLVDSADGDRVLPWNGGSVIDTVAYQNLIPGTEYILTGELIRQADGTATGITGSTTFTPSTADGSVDVSFVIPEGYAGEILVAFERLYVGDTTGDPVAVHEDIDDAAQTVTIEEALTEPTQPHKPEPTQPDNPEQSAGQLAATGATIPVAALGAAGILLLLGAMLLRMRRARSGS
ncbi:VaFE repeat-containing surface-anchored protein [Microbacterium sp. MYb62]|uniref:VaFE repeat-containing surface-anchored protein n=1 Tax=Microbacterium sp. MYb62 TaxID=1848690 RepID=UPI0015E3A068|nr:VaFE repeat-containing surface-anchored protein [Microbacterium sp. MYb62]